MILVWQSVNHQRAPLPVVNGELEGLQWQDARHAMVDEFVDIMVREHLAKSPESTSM